MNIHAAENYTQKARFRDAVRNVKILFKEVGVRGKRQDMQAAGKEIGKLRAVNAELGEARGNLDRMVTTRRDEEDVNSLRGIDLKLGML
jgi:hypothetical protein